MSKFNEKISLNENQGKIFVEGFGEQEVNFYRIEGTIHLLIAEFTDQNIDYTAVVNDKMQTLIPFSKSQIQDYFYTKNRNDFCFILYDDENKYSSYHLKKINKQFTKVGQTMSKDNVICQFTECENENYWCIETNCDGLIEYCLYDIENNKIITPFFTKICFEERDDTRVLGLFEKDLFYKDEINNVHIFLDRIMGFIDKNGNFISPLYQVNNEKYYDATSYNHDKKFKSFNYFINALNNKLTTEYLEKDHKIDEAIQLLFDNLYPTEIVHKEKTKAKIIEYDRRKK